MWDQGLKIKTEQEKPRTVLFNKEQGETGNPQERWSFCTLTKATQTANSIF